MEAEIKTEQWEAFATRYVLKAAALENEVERLKGELKIALGAVERRKEELREATITIQSYEYGTKGDNDERS